MNFSEILNKKIHDLTIQRDNINEVIADPRHHVTRARNMTLQVIQQLKDLDLDKQGLESELAAVFQQIPDFVGDAWTQASKSCSVLNTEIARWTEMAVMYEEYKTSQSISNVEQALSEDKLSQAIKDGDVTEPSRHSAMRRKPGERPPITLGAYRKLSAKLESGEDS